MKQQNAAQCNTPLKKKMKNRRKKEFKQQHGNEIYTHSIIRESQESEQNSKTENLDGKVYTQERIGEDETTSGPERRILVKLVLSASRSCCVAVLLPSCEPVCVKHSNAI